MHAWDMMHWGWGGLIVSAIFWILLIALVIWIVRTLTTGQQRNASGGTARDILKKRYARGEIDRDEYLEKMRDLD